MVDNQEYEKQFLAAYDKYADAIFRYCYYRVFDREKAKDLVQETYIRTWKYIVQGNQVENIQALIYKIARNIIIDDSRKKKSVSLDYLSEKGFHPQTDTRQKDENIFLGKEMLEVIKSLEEKYQEVIILKYIEDLSIKEIASLLGETENNVSVRLNRGFARLREILENQKT